MEERAEKRARREQQERGADVIAAALTRLERGAGDTAVQGFIPSATFKGARPGYIFKRGNAGVGYYPDTAQGSHANQSAQASRAGGALDRKAPAAPLDPEKLLEEAEKQNQAQAEAQVEVLDVRGMKKLVLGFERKLRDNLEARMKHADAPDKFVESELDLDEEIRKLHALATAPHLYPDLVSLNAVPSILGLLSHENPDIAVDTVEVLHELTEADVLEESKEGALALVECLMQHNALELLVQGLARFDEKLPEEAAAVFNTLGVVENMVEVKSEVAELVLSRTKLLRWLLNRVKAREFDSNKFYAAELLSILMQGIEANQRKLGSMNGVDALLQAVAMYKGREPQTQDEEEMVANLFDALCWVVMPPENKEKFVQAEGIELMLLVIKNKKYARLAALKMLDFALTRCPAGCERFIDVLGLKSVFTAFMGKIKATAKRKLTPEEREDEEHRSTSLLASLFMGLSRGSRRDRLGAKFVENEFEKIDRLIELYVKYRDSVREAEEKYRRGLEEYEDDEEDEEELMQARMDGGLYILQMVTLILAHVWSFGHEGMQRRVLLLLTQIDLSLKEVRGVLQEHSDNIGDQDGVEERQKRQKRIQKLINGMYGPDEEPPASEPVGDAIAAGDLADEAPPPPPPEEPHPDEANDKPKEKKESREHKDKKKRKKRDREKKGDIDDIDMEIDWDMEKKDD